MYIVYLTLVEDLGEVCVFHDCGGGVGRRRGGEDRHGGVCR